MEIHRTEESIWVALRRFSASLNSLVCELEIISIVHKRDLGSYLFS